VDFVQAVEEAVSACDVFLAVIGPHWLTVADNDGQRRLDQWNDFVRMEIAAALKQEKVVIPVLVGQGKMPPPDELPEDIRSLTRRNAMELSHQRFPDDAQKLFEAIRKFFPAYISATPEIVRQKAAAVKAIRDEVVSDTNSPLYKFRVENRLFPVIGEGNPDAHILFLGEAPGKFEIEQGKVFVGPSGEVLNEMLAGIGLKREDVYITNLLFDRPSGKNGPSQAEIAFYAPYVDRIINAIQPSVIATMGGSATEYLLKKLDLPEKGSKIGALHGKLIRATLAYGDIHIVPLYHPALVLYSGSKKETLKSDFQKLKLFI
jgi:uracil-DNA glycosylase